MAITETINSRFEDLRSYNKDVFTDARSVGLINKNPLSVSDYRYDASNKFDQVFNARKDLNTPKAVIEACAGDIAKIFIHMAASAVLIVTNIALLAPAAYSSSKKLLKAKEEETTSTEKNPDLLAESQPATGDQKQDADDSSTKSPWLHNSFAYALVGGLNEFVTCIYSAFCHVGMFFKTSGHHIGTFLSSAYGNIKGKFAATKQDETEATPTPSAELSSDLKKDQAKEHDQTQSNGSTQKDEAELGIDGEETTPKGPQNDAAV